MAVAPTVACGTPFRIGVTSTSRSPSTVPGTYGSRKFVVDVQPVTILCNGGSGQLNEYDPPGVSFNT